MNVLRTLLVLPDDLAGVAGAVALAGAADASGRQLVTVVPAALAPVAALLPGVAATLPRGGDVAGEAATRQLGEAIVLAPELALLWRLRRAGVAYRWGYARGLATVLLRPAVPPPRAAAAEHPPWSALATAMDLPPLDPAARLALTDGVRERARERLTRARLPADEPFVALLPRPFAGSGRVPWEWWAELSRQLRRRSPERRQLVVVEPADLWLGVRVFEETGKLHPVLGPDVDGATLAGILARAAVAIGRPGGRLALARASGCPTIDADRLPPVDAARRALPDLAAAVAGIETALRDAVPPAGAADPP